MTIYDMNILISVIALVLNLYVAAVLIIRWRREKHGRHKSNARYHR